jgi:hypothetical protein
MEERDELGSVEGTFAEIRLHSVYQRLLWAWNDEVDLWRLRQDITC